MGGWMHRIHADASTQPNSVTARLTGFDSALDNNKDECPYAFKTTDGPSFPGFTINSNPQMISFVIAKRNPIQFSVDLQYSSMPEIGTDGFINTPGWNGCTKPNNGGIQVFRTQNDLPDDTYIFLDTEEFNVTIDVVPNFDAKHKLVVQDRNDPIPVVFTGTQEQRHDFSYAKNVAVMFQNMRGDQGFLLRYSSALIAKTTAMSPTPESSTAPSSSSTSPSPTTPTTSSGFRAADTFAGSMISALLLSLFL
ncbi:hypothetical protein PRIPAC_75584 [Pristionchus pacificus]|uniref:Uncharacterized protein n=1 Tax=Pristionchus pacificus TaxID=54126 RepID=A0A2A6CR04_PRIPA|nr:hypothetical protein PRIPAC_75584 [Pristionchus pacificus]|eukprot:PDM80645.1 hypothetical protein PRIPAC_35648 [Pristionchus pacificus]